eukprot:13809839-Ditylum_brightwellii.AAC.1
MPPRAYAYEIILLPHLTMSHYSPSLRGEKKEEIAENKQKKNIKQNEFEMRLSFTVTLVKSSRDGRNSRFDAMFLPKPGKAQQ